MLCAEYDLKIIQGWLGNSNIATTGDTYSKKNLTLLSL